MLSFNGKSEFYPKVKESIEACGFIVFDSITGIGRSHASKPDYIAMKSSTVLIGEIKSPSESPLSSSWRKPQKSDTKEFALVRLEIDSKEKNGLISKDAGGHEIIIRGQIYDYRRKVGLTYNLPVECPQNLKLVGGYSAPSEEQKNIEQAFYNCNKRFIEKILHKNSIVTYIFSF